MPLRPLLSLTDGGLPWVAQGKTIGINAEQKADFTNRLFKLVDISAPGVPSIFSNPFVFYTQLSTGDNVAFQKFSALIKGMFLGIIQPVEINNQPEEQQLGQLESVVRRVKQGFQEFVVLKWKNFPIGGTYPDCLVFPGARFEAGEYGGDVTWDKLNLEIQEKENQLGLAIVKALYQKWIAEISFLWEQRVRAIQGLPTDGDLLHGTQTPLWLQQLTQLGNQWTTSVQAPVNALADWTSPLINVHVLVDHNNVVAIPLRTVTKNIFCEKILKFDNSRMPDFPVKSDYLKLIDTSNREGELYHLILRGWQGQIDWTTQNTIHVDKASILLWPNFKAAGWNINYALFISSPIFAGYKPSLNFINSGRQNKTLLAKLKDEPGTFAGCSTREEITHIEALCQNEPVGIFLDGRPQIETATGNLMVSLDFGTAHTCLGIWDGNKHENLVLQDMTVDMLGMKYFDQDMFQRVAAWLPTFGGDCKVLPSELMFYAERNMLPRNLSEPIKYFIIPDMSYPVTRGTVYGFKWHEWPEFSGHRGDLVKTYLKMVLHMALANLRRQHNIQNVNIVATYPLAFDKTRYTDYKNWLNGLIGQLKQETGMGIQLAVTTVNNQSELIGESYAAKALFIVPPPAAELVVDIGGGTTDIALLVGSNILAIDSIRYGGNYFLDYLAAKNLLPQVKNEKIEFLNKDRSGFAIQKAIRILGSIKGIFDEYTDDQRPKAEDALLRFFAGLFDYLKVLLACNNLQKDIFLYPMGNGWRFIEGMRNVPNINYFIEDWFNHRGIQVRANVSDTIFRLKEGLVLGANEIVRENVYNPPPDFIEEPVRSRVGAKAVIAWDSGSLQFQPSDPIPSGGLGFTIQNNPRFNTKDFIRNLPFSKQKNISDEVIAHKLNAACMNDMMGLTGGGLSLTRSIYAKFLEEIYPVVYL